MKIVVQHLETKLYLGAKRNWIKDLAQALAFEDAVLALSFCLRESLREVRLVRRDAERGGELYIYPFGGDPVVRRELKKLRQSIRESRRLKSERRLIRGQIDALMAEGKETKKLFPFKSRRGNEKEEG